MPNNLREHIAELRKEGADYIAIDEVEPLLNRLDELEEFVVKFKESVSKAPTVTPDRSGMVPIQLDPRIASIKSAYHDWKVTGVTYKGPAENRYNKLCKLLEGL